MLQNKSHSIELLRTFQTSIYLELWRSDGTEAATTMITAQNIGKRRLYDYGLVASSDALYFLGTQDDHTWVLWKIKPFDGMLQ